MQLSTSEKNRLKSKYGKWAVVTGASSGIGKEIAERLAESGLNLLLTARRKKLLDDIARTLEAKYQIRTRVVEADLSKKEGIDSVFIESEDLDIGMLVANAGFGTSGEFLNSPIEDEISILEVNCSALMIMTHYFGRRFVKRGK